MKLSFLGTRGEIELRSPRHRLHSSLLVLYRRTPLVVDCGLDWLERLSALRARALLLTHAHPDHAGGLRRGAPWPVYATEETWRALGRLAEAPSSERMRRRFYAMLATESAAVDAPVPAAAPRRAVREPISWWLLRPALPAGRRGLPEWAAPLGSALTRD